MTGHPVRSPAIDINPVADGYVLYDSGSDQVHYLNHTAAIVLELCDGQHDAAQITAFLQELYAGAEDVAASVQACLRQLCGLGLVQWPAQSTEQGTAEQTAQAEPAQPAPVGTAVPAQAGPAQAGPAQEVRPRPLSG